MKACFDEGALQAYIDDELELARAREVAAHIATCEACAATARESAEQFAFLSHALGASENVSVPTEQLRSRIDAAIAELQPTSIASPANSTTFVERLRAFTSSLAAQFASMPRQATAFASLFVAAVLLATIFYVLRPQSHASHDKQAGAREIAEVKPPINEASASVRGSAGNAETGSDESKQADESKHTDDRAARDVQNPVLRRGMREGVGRVGFTEAKFVQLDSRKADVTRAANDDASDAALLPVEKSYVSAIASLKSSIEQQKAQTMTPTLRAEYERNIAVVDRAIAASRTAARRDPADKDAQDFLRAAYQDKLELLRAVADQAQIASIGR